MAIKTWVGGASGNQTSAAVAANWSPSGVPQAGDTVVFDGAVSVKNVDAGLSGSNTLSGVALAAVYIYDTYTGLIGTAAIPLNLNPGDLFIHYPSGQASTAGSKRINLNLESVQCDVNIYGSATTGQDTALPSIRIIGTHANNTLNVTGAAKVGIAITEQDEVATFLTVNLAESLAGGTPTVFLGTGCTLTTIEVGAGTLYNRGANVTTAIVAAGAVYQANGLATHTTLDARGMAIYNSAGTIATLKIGGAGTANFSGDPRPKTVTNCQIEKGGTLYADNGNPLAITFTNGIDLNQCSAEDITLDVGSHLTVSLSSI